MDKNVLKFILTGVDDSAVVATMSIGDQRIENAGNIEIVEEIIAAATEDLKRLFPNDDINILDLEAPNETLPVMIQGRQSTLIERQLTLDRLQREHRSALDVREEHEGRTAEIAATLERFALLAAVYDSDVGRLESLEEGAAALMAGARRPCPLCGADPDHQHMGPSPSVCRALPAGGACRNRNIRAEHADLTKTMASLGPNRMVSSPAFVVNLTRSRTSNSRPSRSLRLRRLVDQPTRSSIARVSACATDWHLKIESKA